MDVTGDLALVHGSPVTYTTNLTANNLSPEELELTVMFPQGLYKQESNGSQSPSLMELEIRVKEFGATSWLDPVQFWKKDIEHVGDYKATLSIMRPNSIPATSRWIVQVTRTTPTAAVTTEAPYTRNLTNISFSALANLANRTYGGTALMAIWVEDINVVNKTYPITSIRAKGMQFMIPSLTHYNPATKTYTGTWDGTLEGGATPTLHYTSNPAWQIYSILSDKLVKNIPISYPVVKTYPYMYSFGVPEDELGIWNFYNFGKYCDELVFGNPRFEFNNQFLQRMPRKDFLDYILGLAQAKLVRKYGLLCVAWDRFLSVEDLASVPLIHSGTLKKGFEESKTHMSEAYTHITVMFKDIRNNNVPTTVTANSTELVPYLVTEGLLPDTVDDMYFVTKFGYQPYIVELPGAINYTTALLKARALLWDALVGNKFITFSGGFELAHYYEGQVIGTIDDSLQFTKKTGFLTEASSYNSATDVATIVFSESMTLTPSSTVYLFVKDPSSLAEEQLAADLIAKKIFPKPFTPRAENFAVGETEKTSTTFTFTIPTEFLEFSPFFVVEANLEYYTITEVNFSEDTYSITAKVYNPLKFAFLESTGYVRTRQPVPSYNIPPPSNIVPTVSVHQGLSSAQLFLELKFQHVVSLAVAQRYALRYKISASMLGATAQTKELTRGMMRRIEAETYLGSVAEVDSYDPDTVLLAHTTTLEFYMKFDFTYQNYSQYFLDGTTELDEIQAPIKLRIEIEPALDAIEVKPISSFSYVNSVTLTKPAVFGTIQVNS